MHFLIHDQSELNQKYLYLPRSPQKFRLHPLIHTLLEFDLVQDVDICQRFTGFGNAPPQTGHTFSDGWTMRSALHLGHLTGWTFTRLISSGSRLVNRFLRFRKVLLLCLETLKDRIFCIAFPAIDMFIASRPGNVAVATWTLFWVFWWKRSLNFCH